jgi:hypothetical protein
MQLHTLPVTVEVRELPKSFQNTRKMDAFFRGLYPNTVSAVTVAQDCSELSQLIDDRTDLVAKMEQAYGKLAVSASTLYFVDHFARSVRRLCKT